MRSLALLLAVLALPAAAAVPEKGEGTITVLGGARTIFPSNQSNEPGSTHQAFQPEGIIGFGYQYDDELHFKIEIGYALDRYHSAAGDLQIKSVPILLGLDTALARGDWYTVYGAGALGYSLNSGTRGTDYNEANSTAFSLALGVRMRLSDRFAVVLEDRYTLAKAAVDPADTNLLLNVGGNLFSLGLQLHFLEPDDKGHPQAP